MRRRAHGIGKAFQAAQTAAARTGKPALALRHRVGVFRREPHAQLDAGIGRNDLEFLDVRDADCTMPSVRLKPSAKSSRSAGVASITA